MAGALFHILVFPGFLFVAALSLVAEFVDRKIYARLQNRVGPPWFQTFADFLKLLGKEQVIPTQANPRMFSLAPVFALAAAMTAFLSTPLWKMESLFSFNGDVIAVLYLLTVPTLAFFIGGWYSTSLYARMGAVRTVTQLFAYEVPIFMGVLSAALLADTWSLREIAVFYGRHPLYMLVNLPAFLVCVIALLGKLEKVPFDIPEAETEIVAGIFTEYNARLLAFLRLTLDIEMVAASALLAAVFMPLGLGAAPAAGFILSMLKIFLIVALLSFFRTVFARLRIDQMIRFCWKCLVPVVLLQLFVNMALKGVLF